MTGSYQIQVKNNKVSFSITLERNITILTGLSAPGKTSLINLIANYEEYGKKSGVKLTSAKPCYAIQTGLGWYDRISNIQNGIVFIDEGLAFIHSQDFARLLDNNSNYFVLVTREGLPQIPYSINSILGLRESSKKDNCVYNESYRCYEGLIEDSIQLESKKILIVEDSNSDYELFNTTFNGKCVSANGKSNIIHKVMEYGNTASAVIADGAAIGAEIQKLLYYKTKMMQIDMFLPESFEWMILKSGIVRDVRLDDILEHPSDYIASEKYISWEQYFTDLLIGLTKKTPLHYKKNHLNKAYLQESNKSKILSVLEQKESCISKMRVF